LHHRQPGAGAGASHADGGHRPGRRRPPLPAGDRRGRGRREGGRAGRAHLPALARGGGEPQLFLEGASSADMMKDRVAVIGVGCTKFGDRYERSFEELICDAAFDAYADAGIEPAEIEAAYLGTYLPGPGGGKAAVSLADALRLYDRPITAWPFGLLDCCPTTDGAAAAIICRADLAKRFRKPPVLVKGAGLAVATGRPYFDPTFDYLGFRSTQAAARQAYQAAGITAEDIDFAEV